MKQDATPAETADHAVKKVFAILGVDVDDPASVEEFRQDLRFGRRMRRATDHGMFVIWGLVAAGLFWVFVDGILTRIKQVMGG